MKGMISRVFRRLSWGVVGILAMGTLIAFTKYTAKTPARPVSPAKPASSAKPASIYDKPADAKALVAKATAQAKKEDQRVLLMFVDRCSWCYKLHNLFASNSNPEIRQILRDEYVLTTIDTASPNAHELLEACQNALSKDELEKEVGDHFLAVLDAEGKIVTAQRTDPLEEGDHHNPERVRKFLDRWKIPSKDAKVLLEGALSRASSDDKRILLTFGAPWCVWCHRLRDWLALPEIAAIFDRDFIIVQVDTERMTGGKDVLMLYRPEPSGIIPWFTVLDAKGKSLATSDARDGNIGYPSKPNAIDYFVSIVKEQGRHVDARQLDQIRKSLEDAAERIKHESGR